MANKVDLRLQKINNAISTVNNVYSIYERTKTYVNKYQESKRSDNSYTLTFTPQQLPDATNKVLATWLKDNVDAESQRNLSIFISSGYIQTMPSLSSADQRWHISRPDLTASVWVETEIEETENFSIRNESIKFYFPTQVDLDLFVDEINAIIKEKFSSEEVKTSYVYIANVSGIKKMVGKITRTLDTVYLAEGQKEDLLNDITQFIDSKERYEQLGIPYHRGYLLYGPPGTGKTTIVQAIAKELNKDVFSISLNTLSDAGLDAIMSEASTDEILLIEDIDTYTAARDRNADSKLSTASILNALDGITTPHGLITFLTSNHEDSLDPAMLRPGRVDRKFHIGPCTPYQVNNYIETATGKNPKLKGSQYYDFTMAELSEVVKANINNSSSKTYDAFMQFLREKGAK